MGFNRRKLEDQRPEAANKEAAKRRAVTPEQVADTALTLISIGLEAEPFMRLSH
jgi:hypothetical protein